MTSEARRSICVTTAVILAFAAAVTVRVVFDETFAPRIFHGVLIEESRSKKKREAAANRIFVTTNLGTECVAYFVTKGFETRRQAVLFFGGDASEEQYVAPAMLEGDLAQQKKLMQLWADRLRVRYVYVSRVGLQGSSGNHERRLPKETLVMNAVVDGLKTRLATSLLGNAAELLLQTGNHDGRPRYRKTCLSSSWHRRAWQCRRPSPTEASARARVLQEATALPGRHRGMLHVA